MVLTKHTLDNFKGHLHVEMEHVTVLSPKHETEECEGSIDELHLKFPLCSFNIDILPSFHFVVVDWRKHIKSVGSDAAAQKKISEEKEPAKGTGLQVYLRTTLELFMHIVFF